MSIFSKYKIQVLGGNEGFILNRSALGLAMLNNAAPDWVDYLCDTVRISVHRGGTPNLFSANIEAGTLNFRLYNHPLDPALQPNRAIRLLRLVGSNWVPLFTGVIQDLSLEFSKSSSDTWINILAVDGVASLSNTARYGATAESSDSWSRRIEDLNKSALTPVSAPNSDGGLDPYFIAKTAYESTLANHYKLVSESVGAVWWVDATNVARFYRWPDNPSNFPIVANFSDVHSGADPLHVCYNDVRIAYDTRNIVNVLTLANTEGIDEEGNSVQRNWLFRSLTSIASWGARAYALDTNIVGVGVQQERANEIFAQFNTVQKRPSFVRFNGDTNPEVMASLDIYSRVTVTRSGATYTCRVASIEHELTPTGHMVDLQLI